MLRNKYLKYWNIVSSPRINCPVTFPKDKNILFHIFYISIKLIHFMVLSLHNGEQYDLNFTQHDQILTVIWMIFVSTAESILG